MKSYRYFGEEMEVLGNRLDHARKMANESKSLWAKVYWANNVKRLLFQWQQLPILHDGDAQVTIIPKWTINYDFYEKSEEIGLYGINDRIYELVMNKGPDLNASWENHRAARLARAQ